MKKKVVAILVILCTIICGCGNDEYNRTKDEEISYAPPKARNTILSSLSSVEILENGDVAVFFANKDEYKIYGNIYTADGASKAIDIEDADLSGWFKVDTLNRGFYISDRNILVFDENGQKIKEIDFPSDASFNTPYAISNDLHKMAYVAETEKNGESIPYLAVIDLVSNEKKVFQQLSAADKNVPSRLLMLKFSSDDSHLGYFGITNPNSQTCTECFGYVDLERNHLYMERGKELRAEFCGDIIWLYDKCVDIGKRSGGNVYRFDFMHGVKEVISVDEADESQYLRRADRGDVFITMLPGNERKEVILSVYENGIKVKSAILHFDSAESFEASTSGDAIFGFSKRSGQIYFGRYTIEREKGEAICTLEMIKPQ